MNRVQLLLLIGLLPSTVSAHDLEQSFADALESSDDAAVKSMIRLPAVLCTSGEWKYVIKRDDLAGVNLDDVISDRKELLSVLREEKAGNPYSNFRSNPAHGERFYQTAGENIFVDDAGISRIIPRDFRKCAPPKISLCPKKEDNQRISELVHLSFMLGMNLFELPQMSGRRSLGYFSNSDHKIIGFRLPFATEDFINENLPRSLNQITISYDPASYYGAPGWTFNRGRGYLMIIPSALADLPAVRGCDGDQKVCDFSNQTAFQYTDELYGYSSVLFARQEKNGSCTLEKYYMRDLFPETVAVNDRSLYLELAENAPHGVPKYQIENSTWTDAKDKSVRLNFDGKKVKLHVKGHNYIFESFSAIGSARYYGIINDPAGKGPLHEHHVYFVPENDGSASLSEATGILMLVMKNGYMEQDSLIYRFVPAGK